MIGLEEAIAEAWRIRKLHFSKNITFSYPRNTQAVSVTGSSCDLKCSHCGGHYLQQMQPVEELLAKNSCEATSFLISGGCTKEGKVPFAEYVARLAAFKPQKRFNLHVGLVGEADMAAIAALADRVSFDFVGADETIQEVFGLPYKVADYATCYQKLRQHSSVVPHICIGLHGGKLKGEYQALEILGKIGVEELTFIVFTPTKGTVFVDCQPPAIEEVISLLTTARKQFPTVPIHLGCMRPGGSYRQKLDLLALQCGVNSIVNPVPAAVRLAKELGLTISKQEECCSL